LREADDVVLKFLEEKQLSSKVWQFPVVMIPLSKKGKSGESIVLRPVNSVDGMTAEFNPLSRELMCELADRIMSLGGIDMVLLDITNKPPATIEWE
jgi:GMP synthase (glutamine-hydrolysing)